jgi:hypothetical protein
MLKIGQYHVIGSYHPGNANYGRGEPRDTPPEPASFDIESVLLNGKDITDQLFPSILQSLEDEAVRIYREEME